MYTKKELPENITMLVTGSGKRTEHEPKNSVLLRTDDATMFFDRESEFGNIAHALVDRYNEYPTLIKENELLKQRNEELQKALKDLHHACMMDSHIPTEWWKNNKEIVATAGILIQNNK